MNDRQKLVLEKLADELLRIADAEHWAQLDSEADEEADEEALEVFVRTLLETAQRPRVIYRDGGYNP